MTQPSMTKLFDNDVAAAILAEGRHIMQWMDATGDTKLVFDPNDADEVANAHATFDNLRKKGYAAFHVDDKGQQAEQMHAFDPAAGRIILAKALVGG